MTRHFMHQTARPYGQLCLALMPDIWLFIFARYGHARLSSCSASQFIIGAVKSLRNGSANMDVLVAMGSLAAYVYGIIVLPRHRL